jgi:hypothetical protein
MVSPSDFIFEVRCSLLGGGEIRGAENFRWQIGERVGVMMTISRIHCFGFCLVFFERALI